MAVPQKKFVSQFTMMGTVISLTFFEPQQAAVEAAYDYLEQMDQVFSVNRPDSELSAVNRAAGQHAVTVSPQCFDLIHDALSYSRQHATSFNVLIGPLVKLWKIGFGGHQVPAPRAIQQRLQLMNLDQVELNATQHSVFLKQAGMQLDLGAIAKGYFADQIVAQLQRDGITNAIVNLGGNVKLLGQNPLTQSGRWQVGVQAPAAPRGYPELQVEMRARTVVTSGIFERYFEANGHRYHHILDPQTGYPVENQLDQVTIITAQSELAEVLSTVTYFEGPKAGAALIERLPGTEAIFIDRKQQITVTSGLKPRRKGVFYIE